MGKIKLPKYICCLLDEIIKKQGKSLALWISMQNPKLLTGNYQEFYKLMEYSYENNCEELAKAILFGYEPEETEEERKEREVKEKIKEYLEWRVTFDKNLANKLTNDLYNIAHGKE